MQVDVIKVSRTLSTKDNILFDLHNLSEQLHHIISSLSITVHCTKPMFIKSKVLYYSARWINATTKYNRHLSNLYSQDSARYIIMTNINISLLPKIHWRSKLPLNKNHWPMGLSFPCTMLIQMNRDLSLYCTSEHYWSLSELISLFPFLNC